MLVRDRLSLDGSNREKLPNGFLRIRRATFARTGIQSYTAGELGIKDRPANDVLRIWRPPEEVFNPDSMSTFGNAPVTDDHPSEGVTAANSRRLSRGMSGDTVLQDGDHMVGSMLITDAELIAKIEAGKAELSNGYDMRLEIKSGVTPSGETYDAIMRNIVGNHIAVVDAGRCGGSCRIGDGATQAQDCGCGCGGEKASSKQEGRVSDINTKTITFDGLPLVVTDAAEAAINMLKGKLQEAATALSASDAKAATAESALADAKTAHEAEVATLKTQIPTGAALDALVAARVSLLADAKRLAPQIALDGKTDDEIRKAVVTARLGDAAVAGKDDTFHRHAFDALVIQNPQPTNQQPGATPPAPVGDQLGNFLTGGQPTPVNAADTADKAWAENNAFLADAWKGEQKAN